MSWQQEVGRITHATFNEDELSKLSIITPRVSSDNIGWIYRIVVPLIDEFLRIRWAIYSYWEIASSSVHFHQMKDLHIICSNTITSTRRAMHSLLNLIFLTRENFKNRISKSTIIDFFVYYYRVGSLMCRVIVSHSASMIISQISPVFLSMLQSNSLGWVGWGRVALSLRWH